MRRRGLLGVTLVAPNLARAAWPDRPLRMVVAYPAGGGTDLMARAVVQQMQVELGQSVVVENRSGATGAIGAAAVAAAAPDGYTLLFINGSDLTLRPLMDRAATYDVDRDFVLISLLGVTPVVLAVRSGLPARSVAELVALARASRQPLTCANTGAGGIMHLTSEVFRQRAGIQLEQIPYRGAAPAVNDTAAGQVDMIFVGLPPVLPHVQSGRLRILAVSTPRRSSSVPDVPTLDEQGMPGFDMSNVVGLVAPRGTPPAIIERLNTAAVAAVRHQRVQEIFQRNGADTVGNTAEEYATYTRAERERFAEVIRTTGFRGE